VDDLGRRGADSPTLRDPVAQAALERDGFAVVPLLDADEVAELLDAHERLVGRPDEAEIVFDYMQDDRSVMQAVTRMLAPYWARRVPEVFTDHAVAFSTFVVKYAGQESGMYLHDDRSFVDERRFRACTMWVPLVDTSPELQNGALHLVPGSHRIMAAASGTNTPDWIRPYEHYLLQHLRPVAVPAGHALVYDTKSLHWSPPNLSDAPRPAIASAMYPREADLVHVVGEGLHHRRVYAVDPEFFVLHHPRSLEQRMPDGYELVEEYDEAEVEADPATIAAAVGHPDELPVAWAEPEGDAPDADADDRTTPAVGEAEGEEGGDPLTAPRRRPLVRRVGGRLKRMVASRT
jgi:hypothetical protein